MADPIFVAREGELGQLWQFLDRALGSQGQVCFVTGEAGSGKTALVTEFARRVQEEHSDLVAAIGQCDAQTGIGDPYLPFREVLCQLTGDVDAKLAQGAITQENASRLRKLVVVSGQILVEVAPDLVGLFVPGAHIVGELGNDVVPRPLAERGEKDHRGDTDSNSERGQKGAQSLTANRPANESDKLDYVHPTPHFGFGISDFGLSTHPPFEGGGWRGNSKFEIRNLKFFIFLPTLPRDRVVPLDGQGRPRKTLRPPPTLPARRQ